MRRTVANSIGSGIGIAWLALSAPGCGPAPGRVGPPAPSATNIETSIYLVGDAGAPDPRGEPVLAALSAALQASAAADWVVFLGDNVYPAGLPAAGQPGRSEAERRLRAQVEAAAQGGVTKVFFIGGNHDWNYAGLDGWARVIEQETFIEALDSARIEYLPDRGCPGPVFRDAGAYVRMVFIDTEWWLRSAGRPYGESSPCATKNEQQVTDSIRAMLASGGGRKILVLGHHPMTTGGTHGGHFTLRQHIFPLTDLKRWLWLPLPLIGSAYPIARILGISNQDVTGSRYARMRDSLRAAFRVSPPLLHAAGHEHNLQLLEGEGTRFQIVSGTGIYGHTSDVGWNERTLFAASRSGFVRLDVQHDGRVRVSIVIVDAKGQGREAYSRYFE
jgi:hypothetical protein